MRICDGFGLCLIQTGYENEHYKDKSTICEYNCTLKECPNYILCNTKAPQWYFGCHSGMCSNCNMLFGTWKGGRGIPVFKETDCPICLQIKICISQPKCNHFTCIECFRRCHYGDDEYDIDNKPIFPYDSDIENEYYEDDENPKWENEYELIKLYHIMENEWEIKQQEHFEKEKYLRKCPLCRK